MKVGELYRMMTDNITMGKLYRDFYTVVMNNYPQNITENDLILIKRIKGDLIDQFGTTYDEELYKDLTIVQKNMELLLDHKVSVNGTTIREYPYDIKIGAKGRLVVEIA